ncbi:metacaspase [Trypanosoma brucei equiperdum]|uniref:Metacaspase n=1 Tax=Trypanosoma brucei equiperdum TaxID=630700 RepID=A0A3L6KW02_9TRYP|nr:metacaspase [Trypanosoma brucei equiperdum]
MAWLVKDAKPGDALFLHYSGYGAQVRAEEDKEEEFDQCIVPCDYEENGCILDNELHEIISTLPRGVRLTAVFDCSHAGTLLDLPFSLICSSNDCSAVGEMKRIRTGGDVNAHVLMFSACGDDEAAADLPNAGDFVEGASGSGGAATQCFISMLLNKTPGTIYSLLSTTRDKLREKGFKQSPQMSASRCLSLTEKFTLTELFSVAEPCPNILTGEPRWKTTPLGGE